MTEWPNNGIEFNRWYSGLTRFIVMLKYFAWVDNSEFKYVNIRVDTRNGNFLIFADRKGEGERRRADPNEIAKHVDMKAVDDEMDRIRKVLAMVSDKELGRCLTNKT
jgi:hypothetical protein